MSALPECSPGSNSEPSAAPPQTSGLSGGCSSETTGAIVPLVVPSSSHSRPTQTSASTGLLAGRLRAHGARKLLVATQKRSCDRRELASCAHSSDAASSMSIATSPRRASRAIARDSPRRRRRRGHRAAGRRLRRARGRRFSSNRPKIQRATGMGALIARPSAASASSIVPRCSSSHPRLHTQSRRRADRPAGTPSRRPR